MKDRLGKMFILIGIIVLLIPIGLNIYYNNKNKIAVKSFRIKTIEQKNKTSNKPKNNKKQDVLEETEQDLPIGVLNIPKIREELAIYKDQIDTMETNLDRGVVLLNRETMRNDSFQKQPENTISERATLDPDDNSNIVLTGHRGTLSTNQNIFKNLDQLEIVDIFYIDNGTNFLIYRIYDLQTINPNEGELIYREHNKQQATLVTCTPYLINSHRLIYWGELDNIVPNTNEKIRESFKENQKNSLQLVNPINLLIIVVLFVIVLRRIIKYLKKRESNAL